MDINGLKETMLNEGNLIINIYAHELEGRGV